MVIGDWSADRSQLRESRDGLETAVLCRSLGAMRGEVHKLRHQPLKVLSPFGSQETKWYDNRSLWHPNGTGTGFPVWSLRSDLPDTPSPLKFI